MVHSALLLLSTGLRRYGLYVVTSLRREGSGTVVVGVLLSYEYVEEIGIEWYVHARQAGSASAHQS